MSITTSLHPNFIVYCGPPENKYIDSSSREIVEDRPSGAQAEHRQPAKTTNAPAQQRQRSEIRRKKMVEKHRDAIVEYTTINNILSRNGIVEAKVLASSVDGKPGDLAAASVVKFLDLNTARLQDFIHARKFNSQTFQKAKLLGADGKLNKTRYKS